MTALTHPLLGVGPGCFEVINQHWAVAHNSYTELAAEAGFPALILFLMAIAAAIKNLKDVEKSQQYRDVPEIRLFTQALRAGLGAYIAGACFASIEYLIYSYLLIAYTCALLQIANRPSGSEETGNDWTENKRIYGTISKSRPIWSR